MFELLTALLLCSAANDSIFCNGFGDFMYISVDRPDTPVWSIDSTNHNAAFVTSPNFLTDGKVAIPTRFTWDVGAQTTANTVTMTAATSLTVPVNGFVALAVFCPNTPYALPEGAIVALTITDGSHVLTGSSHMFTLNNGATAFILIVQQTFGSPLVATSVKLKITNVNSNTSAVFATSGQTFDVGEIWFGNLQQFQALTDPKAALIDPTLMRRSHSNQPWPLFVKPYKQWTYNFAPMNTAKAFDSSTSQSFDSVTYSIAAANCALFLTRVYVQGTTTLDNVALYQQACFGKPESVGALSGVKEGMGIWSATATIGEAPP